MADAPLLIALSSAYILAYLRDHPVDWDERERVLAALGGPGDQAGPTPTPAVGEFLALLGSRHGQLFTQDEFVAHCRAVWADWWATLSPGQQQGVRAKLRRNFYPSMIDSLHVWALLHETGCFDCCLVDSIADAVGRTDLTLRRGEWSVRVALVVDSRAARHTRAYKHIYRRPEPPGTVVIPLPLSRPREPGNKRWYCLEDFLPVFWRLGILPPLALREPRRRGRRTTTAGLPACVAQPVQPPLFVL
jgi:hypothetical protein